jgi:hypothetical protein
MSMRTAECVSYHPSKSTSFGHAFRRRGVQRAWEDLQHFFSTCTHVSAPSSIELEVERPTAWDDEAPMWPIIDHALRHFGTPSSEVLHGSADGLSGALSKGGRYTWTRTSAQIESDLAYLIQGEPWPKTAMGPVTLRLSQTFTWKRSTALPSLERAHPQAPPGAGRFSVWLSRRCFVQPSLTFPFVHDDPALLDFLRELRLHLPFRMHNNHFRRVLPGKSPGVFHVRKMPFPVLLS